MPTITKQRPGPSAKSGGSAIDRIVSVKDIRAGIKLCVYGRGKVGKTRFACTFPKPLLLLGTEDGTRSVRNVPDVNFVRLEASADISELVGELRSGRYKTAVVDTAGGLQDLILKEVLGLDDVPIQKSWGMAERSHWMTCGAQLKERLRSLLDLADQQQLNVVIVAHERNFNEEATSDIMMPSVGAALTPTAAAWLNGACDYVCQAFIRELEVIKRSKIGGKDVVTRQGTGKGEYCLRVGPHPVFMTGFRLVNGASLPDVIVDPSYDKIIDLIQGQDRSKK